VDDVVSKDTAVDASVAEDGAGDGAGAEFAGKRVSWAELYFDLVFVFAVGQCAHVIVARPAWAGVGQALGLFATLWWTWIGYVVLYNRGGEDHAPQRLFVLAGTLPCAVAAVELHSVADGHLEGFVFALAGARLVLSLAFFVRPTANGFRGRRVAAGFAASAAVFAVLAVVPAPWRYLLWSLTLIQEASFLLLNTQRSRTRGRGTGNERAARVGRRRPRAESVEAMFATPTDPKLAVDASHLAERFGLFMIILLGEIVVSVGSAALAVHTKDVAYWLGLLAGLVLAGALWWIYFDSAAEINEYVLRASGGNPTMAYGLYAGGHLSPAFALLVVAAGVNLLLTDHPPRAAVWLVSAGLAAYLVGTRAVGSTQGGRFARLAGLATVAATVGLALLRPVLTPTGVLVAVAFWAIGVAAFVSAQGPRRLRLVAADPVSLFTLFSR
jgi:low temperature requirement protein LtrA